LTGAPASTAARAALRLALAAAIAAPGAGCNPFAKDESVSLPCPYVRVLGAGERYLRYRAGAEPERASLEVEASFVSAEATCTYDDPEDANAGMVLDLALVVGISRGPAAPPAEVERLPYFVALLGPDREIVSRQEFTAEIPLPEEGQRFALTEPEEISLTFPPGGARAPWEYEVVVSFQLTPDQLDLANPPRR